MDKKQERLLDYLVSRGLSISNTEELQGIVNGMTADDIIQALTTASIIQENLNATSLGRVLS